LPVSFFPVKLYFHIKNDLCLNTQTLQTCRTVEHIALSDSLQNYMVIQINLQNSSVKTIQLHSKVGSCMGISSHTSVLAVEIDELWHVVLSCRVKRPVCFSVQAKVILFG